MKCLCFELCGCIKLLYELDVELNQTNLSSYSDIIANKFQLEYVQQSVKNLEKKYNEEKLNKSVSNLDEFLSSVEEINNKIEYNPDGNEG